MRRDVSTDSIRPSCCGLICRVRLPLPVPIRMNGARSCPGSPPSRTQAMEEPLAALGLDMAAEDWIRTIFRHRLAPICVTLLLFLIGTLYFASRQRLLAAMEQTAASEERFALAMQGANDGLWDWNVATGEVYFSPQWKRMLGLPPDEPETDLRQWAELLHPEDRDGALAQLRAYLRGRVERLEYEVRMRHRDGHYIDVLARAFAVRRDGGPQAFPGCGDPSGYYGKKRSGA